MGIKPSDEDLVGMHVNMEMALGLAVSLCAKYVLGVNDDDSGQYCPRDFVCLNKPLKSQEVHT